ncbi:MAG TPA: NTP transferase domain-containing protein [Gemmatimonadaceae bacterium]|nr:NTP transferase domain-containing protein [Gemmatimonadaceae bacterium]
MTVALVAMAAGVGSRFGGPKQLEAVGPGGETILDYTLHDAWRAGFGRAVLVIRPELRHAFESTIAARWRDRLEIALVEQDLDDLPAGFARPAQRTRPWGTGHAVLAARAAVGGPFGVVNADDFYGAASFRTLHRFLADRQDTDGRTWAAVGFPLRETLAPAGGVNRALLRTDADGWMEASEEVIGIERAGDEDGRYTGADGVRRTIPGDAPVSMNMWGFAPPLFEELDAGFRRFLAERIGEPKAEFFLPSYVQELVRGGRARVRVLRGAGPWCGVTHPEDLPRVAVVVRELVARGEYPCPAWR